jgi:membrane protein YqaA with SNARE-associated domain
MTEARQAAWVDEHRLGVGVRAAAVACLLWGFAEATLFFVVPDVLLTLLALRSLRRALWGCVFALLGALAGGAVMERWGSSDPAAALAAVDRVPFVPAASIERVREQLEGHGAPAVIAGAWMGRPYKLYAVQASAAGMSAAELLAVSVPARLLRFVFLAVVAHRLGRAIRARRGWRWALGAWAAAWTLNYALYWTAMSS